MKNIFQFLTIVGVTATAAAVLTSCDSDGPNVNDAQQISARFDVNALMANPGAVASFPSNLTALDLVTYTPLQDFNFSTQNVTPPSSAGEAPFVIRPSSAGEVVIDRQRYDYDRTSEQIAVLSLSPLDTVDGPDFDARLADLVQRSAASSTGLATALSTAVNPINSNAIFTLGAAELQTLTEGIESLGFSTENLPNATGIGFGTQFNGNILTVQVDVGNVVVLNTRNITHTITSTNADILNNNEIRGTFILVDTYFDLALQGTTGDTFYTVIIARNPTFSPNLQSQLLVPTLTGTFVLNLGDITSTNPNP